MSRSRLRNQHPKLPPEQRAEGSYSIHVLSGEVRQRDGSLIETPVAVEKRILDQRVLCGFRHPDPLGEHQKSDQKFPKIVGQECLPCECLRRLRESPPLRPGILGKRA